jgi:hypothetical protein
VGHVVAGIIGATAFETANAYRTKQLEYMSMTREEWVKAQERRYVPTPSKRTS